MPVPYRYLSPADAARVSRLQLVARRVVEGVIAGRHKSPHRGFSVEFSEHRDYAPGDELRHLDWRASARSDRHYVKLFEQETNLRATLVLDTSASMGFGSPPKIDYARHLAACLAYLLAKQQDLAGLFAAGEAVQAKLPPGSSAAHLDRLFRSLEAIEARGQTDLPRHLHALAERLPRRSLVIVLSDLWVDPAALIASLRHLRQRRHQAMVLHLLDRAEIDLPYDRRVTLADLETGESLTIDPAEVRDAYQRQVREYLAAVRRACGDGDVAYHELFVDEPYDAALARLLGQSRR